MEHQLPDPARKLWQEHGDMLIAELSELGDEPGAWHLGGGTLLAKDWQHRRSFDLDSRSRPPCPLGNLAKWSSRLLTD